MIIATAGHVDHGKTLLVKALTGVDTDRLPEEKRRGLTIDLGFAYQPIEGNRSIGFVDVPGHERFIHNMLCGVTGIDAALLIVAADDGPMPQTLEHLAILDLLGLDRGTVALTKVDRVSPERVQEVREQIARMLARTSLAAAPVFPVSAVTGEGIEALKAHLRSLARDLPPRAANGNFRLAIDRSFTVAGAGLIVTGTVLSGRIAPGEPVRALLARTPVRVRGIHAQGAQAQIGQAGERCALNLSGADLKSVEIRRGDWIVSEAAPGPTQRMDVRLHVQRAEAHPLEHWTPVHVHLGAADVTARVATLEGSRIAPGESGLVQLVLDHPVGAVHGDRLIVRDQTARRTIGGGRVVDIAPSARARTKSARLEALRALEESDPAAALSRLLPLAAGGLDLASFLANRNLTAREAHDLLESLPLHVVGVGQRRLAFAPAAWQRLRALALGALAAWHARQPDWASVPEERILEGSGAKLQRDLLMALVAELVQEGAIAKSGPGVRLPSHQAVFQAADAMLWTKIVASLEAAGTKPPTVRELAAALREEEKKVLSLLDRGARQGLAFRVNPQRFALPGTLLQLADVVVTLTAQSPGRRMTAAAFRDASGIGRNLAIEILECFDRVKFTRRLGDAREVLRPPREIFGGQ